jgi:hypothetical protein
VSSVGIYIDFSRKYDDMKQYDREKKKGDARGNRVM